MPKEQMSGILLESQMVLLMGFPMVIPMVCKMGSGTANLTVDRLGQLSGRLKEQMSGLLLGSQMVLLMGSSMVTPKVR